MVEHRRHVEPRQKQGHQHTKVAQHRQGRGHHPAGAPVLARAVEAVQGGGEQPPHGDAVHQHPHPPLGQPRTEAVGPLGVQAHGEGGTGLLPHHILLQVPRHEHGVNVDGRHLLLHLSSQLGVGDTFYIENVHRGHRLPPHKGLPDAQLGGPEAAAHQGGVGADGLHKAVHGPFHVRLVVRGRDGPLLLSGGHEGEHLVFSREKQGHPAVDQVKDHLVGGGALLHRQGVQAPLGHAIVGLVQGGHLRQVLALGQGAEHVVAGPLVAHLSHNVEHLHRPLRVVPQVEGAPPEICTPLKDLGDAVGGEGHGDPGLPWGVGRRYLLVSHGIAFPLS